MRDRINHHLRRARRRAILAAVCVAWGTPLVSATEPLASSRGMLPPLPLESTSHVRTNPFCELPLADRSPSLRLVSGDQETDEHDVPSVRLHPVRDTVGLLPLQRPPLLHASENVQTTPMPPPTSIPAATSRRTSVTRSLQDLPEAHAGLLYGLSDSVELSDSIADEEPEANSIELQDSDQYDSGQLEPVRALTPKPRVVVVPKLDDSQVAQPVAIVEVAEPIFDTFATAPVQPPTAPIQPPAEPIQPLQLPLSELPRIAEPTSYPALRRLSDLGQSEPRAPISEEVSGSEFLLPPHPRVVRPITKVLSAGEQKAQMEVPDFPAGDSPYISLSDVRETTDVSTAPSPNPLPGRAREDRTVNSRSMPSGPVASSAGPVGRREAVGRFEPEHPTEPAVAIETTEFPLAARSPLNAGAQSDQIHRSGEKSGAGESENRFARPPVAVVTAPVAFERGSVDPLASIVRPAVEVLQQGGTRKPLADGTASGLRSTTTALDRELAKQTPITSLVMELAQVRTLTIDAPLRDFRIEDTATCQVIQSGGNRLKLIGTGRGVTRLIVWADTDAESQTTTQPMVFLVHVRDGLDATGNVVADPTERLNESIRQVYPGARVRVFRQGERLIVSGECDDRRTATEIVRLVRRSCLVPVDDALSIR